MRRRRGRPGSRGGGEAWPQQTLVGAGPGAQTVDPVRRFNVGQKARVGVGPRLDGSQEENCVPAVRIHCFC
jgi:hypothetical protein